VHQCRPRDPEAKGIVERANGYLETSFLPGRTFTGPADFNSQLSEWLELANTRVVRRIGCAPTQRWAADRAGMLALPPLAPSIGWRTRVRLPRDHYVRLDGNDYSVDPAVVGRMVDVVADLDTVTVACAGTVSPPTGGAGPGTSRSPTRSITRPPSSSRTAPPTAPGRPPRARPMRCSSVTWARTTPRSGWSGRSPDEPTVQHQDRRGGPP
jgi:hypothetical protein